MLSRITAILIVIATLAIIFSGEFRDMVGNFEYNAYGQSILEEIFNNK